VVFVRVTVLVFVEAAVSVVDPVLLGLAPTVSDAVSVSVTSAVLLDV